MPGRDSEAEEIKRINDGWDARKARETALANSEIVPSDEADLRLWPYAWFGLFAVLIVIGILALITGR